jgi:hypothetical protein
MMSDWEKQMAELVKQAKAADKEDKEAAQLFQVMIQTPAWKEFVKKLERRQQMFADSLLAPAGSLDKCIGLEWIKGALSGLIMARDLPSITIAAAKELRKAEDDDDA